jgi:hypothetical protein
MNTLIKQIGDITGKYNLASGIPQCKKTKMVARYINPSKYELIGFVDRTNDVVLRPRYHNVRNSLGQFASIVD